MIARRRAEKHRFIKVLFLGGPREAWLWSDLVEESRSRLRALDLIEMALPPWSDIAVRQWKKEAEFGENTDDDSRRFREATGNWYRFLHEVGRLCTERPHEWKNIVADYQRDLIANPAIIECFGLVSECLSVLRGMAENRDPLSIDDLVDAVTGESVAREEVERVLRWADLLCLARSAGDHRWNLDPMLHTLLKPRQNDAQ
jgi:hypothetical protein